MKKNRFLIMVLIGTITFQAKAIIVSISDVQISPEQPFISDVITVESWGGFTEGTLFYDTSVFAKDDLSLQLDLYFTGGPGPTIPQAWFHDEVIGTLPQGNYDLLVQAYYKSSGAAEYSLHDEYSTSFEVVPEPLTLAFLALGGFLIRAYNLERRIDYGK